jgi:hypothetical protein
MGRWGEWERGRWGERNGLKKGFQPPDISVGTGRQGCAKFFFLLELFLVPTCNAAGQVSSSQKSSVSDAISPQQLKQRKTKRGIEEARA